VESKSRIRFYWERVEFLKAHGFQYDPEKESYVDPSGWALPSHEVYNTLDEMTFEAFCAYVVKRPVEGEA
jgi:hypothetical protein